MSASHSNIQIYQTEDGETSVSVTFDEDTVWLSLIQIAELFERDKSVISRHINNIFKEKELDRVATVANFATVQTEGSRQIKRHVDYYNLDVIISVGYRVKSVRGTQFRIWASGMLKQLLIKGYVLNEQRLAQQTQELKELKQTVKLLGNVLEYKPFSANESKALLQVVADFATALDVLDKYDYQTLELGESVCVETYVLTYSKAIELIKTVKEKYGNSQLFGQEKDRSFESSIATVYQTFGGLELYPSVEEKAANLLYFITKNHSFSDGNKRIAAFLFLHFLERNQLLYTEFNEKRIDDAALVALTLMIAVSKPEEKDILIKVVVSLLKAK